MSEQPTPLRGTVYTCTTLHAAAEPFEKDLPFQIAIVVTDDGRRLTARIEGERVAIGDRVGKTRERGDISIFAFDSNSKV